MSEICLLVHFPDGYSGLVEVRRFIPLPIWVQGAKYLAHFVLLFPGY